MSVIKVTFKERPEDRKYLDTLDERFVDGVYQGMKKVAIFGEGQAKILAPKRSGHLARSIISGVDKEARKIIAYFGSNLVYAPIQERGGKIFAKSGGYLVFKIGNKVVFTKQVKLKGQKYMSRALMRVKRKGPGIIFREVRRKLESKRG